MSVPQKGSFISLKGVVNLLGFIAFGIFKACLDIFVITLKCIRRHSVL